MCEEDHKMSMRNRVDPNKCRKSSILIEILDNVKMSVFHQIKVQMQQNSNHNSGDFYFVVRI